jgi:hypothetical protein
MNRNRETMALDRPLWWTRLSPTERRAIVWLLAAYMLHLAAFVGFTWYFLTELYVNHDPILLGFYTAVGANLVFFLFVGAAGIYITSRRPHEDNINSRVWYVFRHSISPDLANFLLDQVRTLAAISRNVDVNLTVTNYIEDIKCYELYCYQKYTLLNLLHDVPYVDNNYPVSIFTDKNKLPGYDRKLATLKFARTTKKGCSPVDHLGLDKKEIDIFDDYIGTIKMEIDSASTGGIDASTTEFEMRFWGLWKAGGEFFWRAREYAEDVSVTLKNDLKNRETLVCSLSEDDSETTLAWNEVVTLYSDETVKPQQRLVVFVKEP